MQPEREDEAFQRRAEDDEGTGIIVEGKEFEDNFEKVLWISENPTEHELGTIRAHYRNLE